MRTLVAAVAALATLATVAASPAAAAPASAGAPPTLRLSETARPRLAVTGYALGSLPSRVVRREAHALATLGVAGVSIRRDGGQVRGPNADLNRLLRVAHANGLAASLLMSNWSERLGRFDTEALGRLLRSPRHQDQVADRLAQIVQRGGWDGVTVDLEGIGSSRADGLVSFLGRLRDALPSGAAIDIDVSATTSYRSRGYELRRIAGLVDHVVLMAYDEHGPGWSGPGPIGSLPWQRRCLRAALELVPAGQLDLGVAGYGYTWPRHRVGHSVSPRQARRLVASDGASARWRPRAGEWSATLSSGTRLWWSDTRSWRQRIDVAEHRDLHGTALWRLGKADPLP
jgi:spore germination protein YaaH